VVALDNTDVLPSAGLPGRLHFSLPAFTATACALLVLITMASKGFDENGLRAATEMSWRFTFFVFFVALIAGPLAQLLPFAPMQMVGARQRHLIWSFCASFAVYLATILVPNTVRPASMGHEGLTAGMILFIAFGATLVAVIAYSVSGHARAMLGEPSRRAILTAGIGYFWLAYSLTGLAHITGPHRPDSFYGISLSLMVAALLLRFADRFVQTWWRRNVEPGATTVR
jgi:hypothetical protein